MLLSYMPVFLAVCLTLLLITFVSVRQLSERSAVKSSEAVAKNAMQIIEQSLRNIEDTMYATVLSDPRIADFYADANGSFVSSYSAARALGELQYRLPLLYSVYLYRPEDGTVLSPTSIVRIDDFVDKGYVLDKMESDLRYAWGDRRLSGGPGAFDSPEVVSLVKIADLRTNGLLVANVNADALRLLLANSTDTSTGYLELSDGGGAVIASTSGHDRAEVKQERRKLVGADMPYTGWKIEGGLLQAGIFGWVAPVLYGSVSLGALCIALGLVWILYVTRRHYRPVESLVRQIGAFSVKKTPAFPTADMRDEFQTIGLALESLWDQSNRLSRENEENKSFKRAHHFRRLAEGRMEAVSREARKEAEMLGLKLDSGPASAAIVEIDRFFVEVCGNYSDRDRQLLKYALQSALQETFGAAGMEVKSDWLAEHQLGVIALHGYESDPEREIEAALERLRGWSAAHLPFTVTVGIGNEVERSDDISRSFQTAKEALAYKIPLGLNRVIRFRALPGGGHPEIALGLQRIKEISRQFRMGEPSWTVEWSSLLASMQNGCFSGEQIRHLLFVLLFHVQREMIELPTELQTAWVEESARLEDFLKEGETLEEIGEAFTVVFAAVAEQLRLWRESKQNRNVVQEIKRYIDEHYADPNLSQAMLADEFHLHSTSISRLFKEEYGVKFVDYVNEIRIGQAIGLMESTELPVHEIAQTVGFMHSQTFIKMFKKITGFTPGSYRKERTGTG
ncbi:helix-turn-helix domain-containing protein [Paenibacillus hemerocallicola]|nr:helix-turn-helix domain-containing protein [Paenibacillus hemerocallicola]